MAADPAPLARDARCRIYRRGPRRLGARPFLEGASGRARLKEEGLGLEAWGLGPRTSDLADVRPEPRGASREPTPISFWTSAGVKSRICPGLITRSLIGPMCVRRSRSTGCAMASHI